MSTTLPSPNTSWSPSIKRPWPFRLAEWQAPHGRRTAAAIRRLLDGGVDLCDPVVEIDYDTSL
jgi:hypothetical protein